MDKKNIGSQSRILMVLVSAGVVSVLNGMVSVSVSDGLGLGLGWWGRDSITNTVLLICFNTGDSSGFLKAELIA